MTVALPTVTKTLMYNLRTKIRSKNMVLGFFNGAVGPAPLKKPRTIFLDRIFVRRLYMRVFVTVGSATVIAYDGLPILTTDPWINNDAYFGSWTQDYEILPAQMQAIREA